MKENTSRLIDEARKLLTEYPDIDSPQVQAEYSRLLDDLRECANAETKYYVITKNTDECIVVKNIDCLCESDKTKISINHDSEKTILIRYNQELDSIIYTLFEKLKEFYAKSIKICNR